MLSDVFVRLNIMRGFAWVMQWDSGFARWKEVPVTANNEEISEGMKGSMGNVLVEDGEEFVNLMR